MSSLTRVLGLAVLLLLSSASTYAQPLAEGLSLGEDRYFLDGEALRVLRPDGKLDKIDTSSVGMPNDLIKPKNWGATLLVFGTDGVAALTADGIKPIDFAAPPELPAPPESSSEEVKTTFSLWGDKVVRYTDQRNSVQWVRPDQSGTIGDGKAQGPFINGDSMLFLTADGDYVLYRGDSPEQPRSEKLPFSLSEARTAQVEGGFLLWSPTSKTVVRAGGRSFELSEAPSLGVRVLSDGAAIFGLPESLVYISPQDYRNTFATPGFSGEEQFSKAEIFLSSGVLCVVKAEGEKLTTWWCTRDDAQQTGSLEKQTLLGMALPEASTAGVPLMLTETSLEETRVHDDGKVVKNPRTGKESTQFIKGFKLYRLNIDGGWNEIAGDARSRVVGPAQRVGEYFIFATQTEPPHIPGTNRPSDGVYPYPKVVLHAVSFYNARELWTLQLPRGEAPSVARLPDGKEWPVLSPSGPLLFTTEDNRLSAVNLENGEISWTSDSLPLDESRPAMIQWGGTFGLIAVEHTEKRFVVFDSDGKILESLRLNDIFNHARTLNLIGVLVICLALILYIYLAGKKKLFIRRIAGLEALDEAVGRSTEMGKPVLYVTGLADVDDIQTLAALSILSHVAKKTAEYDTPILATTSRAVTFSAAQEVVRDAFTIAGRPDSFSVESVRYISDDQFGYAAGVDGLMVREKPAANFYMGKFYAESLIFAETGNATGAIQIAGTAQANQLPFFVAACDYTLIGEELFAASAYLSGDPLQVGSLRGQDVGKAIVMVILVVLSVDATFGGKLTKWLVSLVGGA
jgi:hypothetical protein